jgi:citrate lyase subunit beta-like protein
MEQLKRESQEAVQLGFTGKQAIHPDQVPVIVDAWRPSPDQLAFAKRIVTAYEHHSFYGRGAFELDGKVIDMPVVKWANGVIARSL